MACSEERETNRVRRTPSLLHRAFSYNGGRASAEGSREGRGDLPSTSAVTKRACTYSSLVCLSHLRIRMYEGADTAL